MSLIDIYVKEQCRYCKNRKNEDCGRGIVVSADETTRCAKCVDYECENPIRRRKK